MQVILIENSKLGNIGDVIEVKNGYANNYLIPKNKAIYFTKNNQIAFNTKKKHFEEQNSKSLDLAKNIQQKVENQNIVIIGAASDDGRLYGSVNSTLIANKINEIIGEKYIDKSMIFLKSPIKDIGVYQLSITPHSILSFNANLIVTRSESEVEQILKAHKKAENKHSANERESSDNS